MYTELIPVNLNVTDGEPTSLQSFDLPHRHFRQIVLRSDLDWQGEFIVHQNNQPLPAVPLAGQAGRVFVYNFPTGGGADVTSGSNPNEDLKQGFRLEVEPLPTGGNKSGQLTGVVITVHPPY